MVTIPLYKTSLILYLTVHREIEIAYLTVDRLKFNNTQLYDASKYIEIQRHVIFAGHVKTYQL